jgi:uncharacterized membrane protein
MAGGAPQPPQHPQQPPQQPPPGAWGQQPPPPQQQPPYGQQQPPYGQPQYGQPASPAAAGMEQNVASALCYVLGLITGVLFLVLEPYNKDKVVRFHAFQSIFFSVASIAVNMSFSIVFSILRRALPYSTWILFSLISLGISLVLLCGWAFLIYKAYNREYFKIPVLGDLAEKQA